MMLPSNTTYEAWDALRREVFNVADQKCFKNVKVRHAEYETCLFYGEYGDSGVAAWDPSEGTCSIMSKRQAIFAVLSGARNYMMNALDAWVIEDNKNVDSYLPWGMLFQGNVEEHK